MVSAALTQDRGELQKLLALATRPGVKYALEKEISIVSKQIEIEEKKEFKEHDLPINLSPSLDDTVMKDDTVTVTPTAQASSSTRSNTTNTIDKRNYKTITMYEVKSGFEYGEKHVILDFRLKGVEKLPKENITCEFNTMTIDLKVIDLPDDVNNFTKEGCKKSNWRFREVALQHDIEPKECGFLVKKNHIVVTMLKWVHPAEPDGFAPRYDIWSQLGGRRKSADNRKHQQPGAKGIIFNDHFF